MTIARANTVSNEVLNSVANDQEDVTVDAPPGSGKTFLLESCTALNTMHLGRTSLIACNSNEQADDITARIARRFPAMPILRLMRHGFEPPPSLVALASVTIDHDAHNAIPVTVATTAKLIESPHPPNADVLMVDEAYQLKHSDYLMIRSLAPRSLTIGDPGQIKPIVQISVRHWASDIAGPHVPAPRVALARNEARRFNLPLSRRLPTDSADIVREAFYPTLSFTGLVAPTSRRLELGMAGMTRADRTLDAALACGSISAVTLPARHTSGTDNEIVALLVELVERILTRNPIIHDEGDERPLRTFDIGIVVSTREQVTAVTQALGVRAPDMLIETANVFQGLERPIILSIHPLSGLLHPSEFNLDPGRMCVSVSRHRSTCILLSRAGIENTLATYMPDDDRFLGQRDDTSYAGWRGHEMFWRRLQQESRIIAA